MYIFPGVWTHLRRFGAKLSKLQYATTPIGSQNENLIGRRVFGIIRNVKAPYLFDEFFASGMEESVSPFLTPDSRKFGKNLSVKRGLFSAALLGVAFAFSFYHPPLSNLSLLFVYFLVGIPALIAASSDLKNLEINIDVLMTLAAFVAVLLDSALEGALLLVLFELSHGMEDSVSKKANSALRNLHHLSPKFAFLLAPDGTLFEKSVREVQIGEHLLVKNGEIVPLDGKVIAGYSSVNLVHLTGESNPVPKGPGEDIPAGARNLEAALTIEVTRISADSTLAKIIQLITQAQEAKPRLQRLFDRFGKYYASSIIALTFLFALLIPFVFAHIPYVGVEGSIYRALAFLIAASPCALIIATPTAYLSAISSCAKKGILLRGGITLDALASCEAVAFDKTGTLTSGELECTGIEPFGNTTLSTDEALQIAYGLERQVVHPIANALCSFAASNNLKPAHIDAFQSIPGSGLEGTVDGRAVFIGLPQRIVSRLSQEQRGKLTQWIEQSHESILATLLVGTDLFLFSFTDPVRKEMASLIEKIKNGHRLVPIMLTGDHLNNAKRVGNLLGIDQIHANLRPEDKLAKITELSDKHHIAMVGDGMNDAPALARATVGISMGKVGSMAAVDASDIVLLNDDIHLLDWLFSKARKTGSIVRQNLTLALGVICLATLPSLLGLLPLWAAVLLHEGGTVLVGLNSLRLLKK